MLEVKMGARQVDRFLPIVGGQPMEAVIGIANTVRARMEGRTVWNVNTTAAGGGVAEMLQALLPYARGTGVDARWLVMDGNPDFFRVTKRLHHALHGSLGDGTPLAEEAHAIYDATMQANLEELGSNVRPHDVVILHDPQTAGLASALIDSGALVIWRCHIGHDSTNLEVESGWQFLARYLSDVPAFVFSRHAYIPAYVDEGRSTIITPGIDAFSPKNQELDEATTRAILVHVGLVEGPAGAAPPVFTREDGSPGRVDRQAEIIRLGHAPSWETPLVVQVSRWDPLKDPIGVLNGFAAIHDGAASRKAELVLAGPNVRAVTDDPEGAQVFEQVCAAWRDLPAAARKRVHLASLPMDDLQENAAMVNALQRHATIVVQKSLHEGFGLTVMEAMWKRRPVVASAVGGIQDQIRDGEDGILLKDPRDLTAFAAALRDLLESPRERARLGEAAHARVTRDFLGLQQLTHYAKLIDRLDRQHEAAGRPVRWDATS